MKKVFMTLAVVLMGVTAANAQFVIGGGIGFAGTAGSTEKTDGKITDKDNSSFAFDFAPKFGYMLMDGKMEVGAAIRLDYDHTTSYEVLEEKAYKDQRNYGLGLSVVPYVRYFFLQKDIFNLGIQADLSLGGSFAIANKYYAIDNYRTQEEADEMINESKDWIDEYKPQYFNWGLTVKPVIMLNLSDHCYMDFSFNALGLGLWGSNNSYQYKGEDDKTIKVQESSFSGGLYLMNQAQDYVSVGFAYKF